MAAVRLAQLALPVTEDADCIPVRSAVKHVFPQAVEVFGGAPVMNWPKFLVKSEP